MAYSPGRWIAPLAPAYGAGGGKLCAVFPRNVHRTPVVTNRPSPRRRLPTTEQPAAHELGCTHYYLNRNPRNYELLGVAEKPKGFATKWERVDYYHR